MRAKGAGGRSWSLPLRLEMGRDQDDDRETPQSCTVTNHTVTSQSEQEERRLRNSSWDRLKTKSPFFLLMALLCL